MKRTDRRAPIGVFDSGVGGLTVLRAIRERLPREATVYLGDTARVPYGPKSPVTVRRYTDEAVDFLLARGVKTIVIACNTATAHAYAAVRDRVEIPVVGVVQPGARSAAERSRGGVIGVIGTQGTVDSRTYDEAILEVRPDAVVHSAACGLFVGLAEEGWTRGDVARLTAEEYLSPLLARGIDSLVLGCTHYPLLKPLIQQVVGPEVELVDSAEATAGAVADRLEDEGLASEGEIPGKAEYFVTDDALRFHVIANRFLGAPIDHLERISLEEGAA